jgi:menaquinone-dependent protoporphyrinogen oxidase
MQVIEAVSPRRTRMKILIVYGSTHRHTARIAEHIAARLRKHGADVVVTGHPTGGDPKQFDAIIVGGRVHGSRYPWRVTRFIRRNHRALTARPSAFFSVSLLQFSLDPAKRSETETLPTRRLPELGWTPDRTEVIGGALLWKAQYGLLAGLFKRMWRRTLGTLLDPIRDEQIFTDWDQVDRFADSFADFAEARLAVNARAAALD